MGKSLRFAVTALLTAFVLIVSATQPIIARADEATPPPDDTPQQVGEAPTQAPTDAQTEAPATDVTASATDEAPATGPEAASLLSSLPDDTSLVVVNAGGESEPLVTQAASDALVNGDPIFCPAGVSPVAGTGGCTSSYTSLAKLIADLNAMNGGTGPGTAGVIWIASTYVSSVNDPTATDIVIDGSAGWGNQELTVQGGWDEGGSGYTNGVSTFNGTTLVVTNWSTHVAISDVYATSGPGGAMGVGLVVATSGDVSLNNVSATGVTGTGAVVSSLGGDATVNGGDFSNNSGDGLVVLANNVSLHDVTANNNGGMSGVTVLSTGDVTMDGVTANGNTHDGAYVVNASGPLAAASAAAFDSAPGNVTISDSTFDGNTSTETEAGLYVLTTGNVTLTNVSASNNLLGDGADIMTGGDGPATFANASPFPPASLIVSDSYFNGNVSNLPGFGFGLWAVGFHDITLNNVSASNNGNKEMGGGAALMASNNVTVNGGNFSNNHGIGLLINSDEALVQCSHITNNTGPGIVAILLGAEPPGAAIALPTGTLTNNSSEVIGNDPNVSLLVGDYVDNPGFECHSQHKPAPIVTVPWNTIQTVSGTEQGLDCTAYAGTILVLPTGDRVTLPCPIGDHATLSALTADQAPGKLDAQFKFVSALEAQVAPSLVGTMIVSFMIPAGQDPASLTILHWDGTKWEDLGGSVGPDGLFNAAGTNAGAYVLVTK